MKKLLLIQLFLFGLVPLLNAGISVKRIGIFADKLKESSGLEFYKGKYLISHTDSGGKAEIYFIKENGEIYRTIEIDEADNDDWEDITSATDGRLFIGDFGNNLNDRKRNQVYILKDDFIDSKDDKVNAKKITFSYEDQKDYPPHKSELNFDAEAMFWMKGKLYILTKCRTEPFTGISYIYELPDEEGEYEAKKIGQIPFCSSSWLFCAVTAADYDEKTNTIAVLLYGKLVLISDFKKNEFWNGKIETFNIAGIKQREAITFIDANHWYMSDEKKKGVGGGNLYKVTRK